MKKLILGIAIMAMGAISAIAIMIVTVLSPLSVWEYCGISGWYGNLLGMELTAPFVISIIIAVVGLAIASWGAFGKEE